MSLRQAISIASVVLGISASLTSAAVVTATASNNSTIKPAGPRTGASNLSFLNVEGDNNNANASYGVVDFTGSAFNAAGATGVNSLSLTLTESNAAFTLPGTLEVFLATNASASINNDGTSTLKYTAGSTPGGIADTTPFGTLIDLGTLAFTTTGNVNSGQQDTLTPATLSQAASNALASALNGGTIRLVLTPNSSTTAATYAGYTNTTAGYAPLLSLTTASAVPEPTSLAAIVGVGATLVRRRRAATIA